MGWFWADGPAPPAPTQALPPHHPSVSQHFAEKSAPPPGCPMHKGTVDPLNRASPAPSKAPPALPPSSCPVPHAQRSAADVSFSSSSPADPSSSSSSSQQSIISRLNPLNYMFHNISQAPAPNQTHALPTSRDPSSIPKGSGDGNWEYPSPQQMYNALLRKGYTDTDVTAVESMVAVHNFLNEGAWAEVREWERRFGRGLARGWEICKRGEQHADETARRLEVKEGWETASEPTLIRFQGRPGEMTPKATMLQVLGWLYPSKFAVEPPFDRHDWYVSRNVAGKAKEVRYVIDYYSGPPEPTGEPVFYLDVRPAMTPAGAAERLIRWGGDVWWKASGGDVREANLAAAAKKSSASAA